MGRKRIMKKSNALDNTIIEHLACLEINKYILQPPFHLQSNVQWNDKGLSFDGDINVYTNKIKKTDFIGTVPIQIKGTTKRKKIKKQKKISHSIDKEDLDVYYKNDNGVLYFVVTIHPDTYVSQPYYKILAPLDIKKLLEEIALTGQKSITINFKKLENGELESICRSFLNSVEKQSKRFIEDAKNIEFSQYKIEYGYVQNNILEDLFEEQAYLYGVLNDVDFPIDIFQLQEMHKETDQLVTIDNETLLIKSALNINKDIIRLTIEDSLTFEFSKQFVDDQLKLINGKVHLSKLKTLGSYVKSLKVLKYLLTYNKIPLSTFEIDTTINEKETFKDIDENIKIHEELIQICKQIGIGEDYIFNEKENLFILFNKIINIFKNKQYDLINFNTPIDKNGMAFCNIELSDYVMATLLFDGNTFIDFFSLEAIKKIGAFLPKDGHVIDCKDTNCRETNWKVSLYVNQNIEDMKRAANFKYEILELSFQDEHHDIDSLNSIDTHLKYINYFDETSDERYLRIAQDLIQRYLLKNPNDIIQRINLYQINNRLDNELSDDEIDDILTIQENAQNKKNKLLEYACEVLLQNRLKSKRLYESLKVDEQDTIKMYPIYNLYKNLISN